MKRLFPAVLALLIFVDVYGVAILLLIDPTINMNLELGYLRSNYLRFAKGFLWGASTSAHQVEGNGTNSNWSEFEKTVDPQGRPHIARGQECGLATDHWNRYKQDIQLMKEMQLNAFRFSIEWSKVEPEEGVFVDSVLDHYEHVVDELRANGIEPFITLHHFTDPLWFDRRGGFERDDAADLFARYASRVVQRLGSKVHFWSTINEPNVYAVEGYYFGHFPPAQHDPAKALLVFKNLLRAHTAGYQAIKKIQPEAQVGLLVNIFIFDPPERLNLLDVLLAHYLNRAFSTSVLDYLTTGVFDFSLPGVASEHFDSGVREAFDFVGLNYYSRFFCHVNLFPNGAPVSIQSPSGAGITDNGWEIYHEGLYRALKMISSRTPKPIIITENGIADTSDKKRADFIEAHVLTANLAVHHGMNVRGYFYWSLLDNFEWTHGYDVRFGLYAVDFATQKRTLRNGSLKYREMILNWIWHQP